MLIKATESFVVTTWFDKLMLEAKVLLVLVNYIDHTQEVKLY